MVINVLEFLERSAEQFPDKTALEDEFGSLTYSEYISKAKKKTGLSIRRIVTEIIRDAVTANRFSL